MKIYPLLISLICTLFCSAQDTFAFSDIGTHPQITERATAQSILASDYLKNNLGFKKGLEEIMLPTKNIQKLLSDGAQEEDTGTLPPTPLCKRGLNHFYDPTTGAGLDETCNFSTLIPGFGALGRMHFHGSPNPEWGSGKCCDPPFLKDRDPNDAEQASTDVNFYSWKKARESFNAALSR